MVPLERFTLLLSIGIKVSGASYFESFRNNVQGAKLKLHAVYMVPHLIEFWNLAAPLINESSRALVISL